MTFDNLEANTLAISLYKHPSKEIGLKSFNPKGEFTFGIKVTKYESKPFGKEPIPWNWSNMIVISPLEAPKISSKMQS
jgi:hypothetical protein